MAENLRQDFVARRNVRLAPNGIAKLRLNHHHRGLDIASPVIVLQKLFSLELEVMEHLGEHATPFAGGAYVERDKRGGPDLGNRFVVVVPGISFVGADFLHVEILDRGVDQCWQNRSIASVLAMNLDGRYDVSFRPATKVGLHPMLLMCKAIVFDVEPAGEPAEREAGGIDRKLRLNRPERQSASLNHFQQDGVDRGVFETLQYRIEVRNLGDVTLGLRIAQIACETAGAHRGVDFEHGGKHRIREWN